MFIFKFLAAAALACTAASGRGPDPWGENVQPNMHTDYLHQFPDLVNEFLGNQTHTDHFKLLKQDGSSLLIGARNVVYNLTLPNLSENLEQRITWNPSDKDRELCILKGKSEDDCQNYIRVLANTDNGRLLVCGTNAYNPRCRYYSNNQVDKEFSGKGLCPYDPRHNSTSIYAGGELYSGTVSDFSGSDPLILKQEIRTDRYDAKQLNSPDFVSSIEDEEHVYFFFRESAVEHINCGKSIYSRVARVCKRDQGGPHKFRNKWTSFLKARLNCSVPGETPFYFDEIQATDSQFAPTVPSGSSGGDQLVYAVFTTPENSIPGSAVCAFKLSDLAVAFEKGPFKGQSGPDANWLPVSHSQVPQPRPGKCNPDGGGVGGSGGSYYNDTSSSEYEQSLHFIQRHPLMDLAVPSYSSSPVFVKTSLGDLGRFTVIAVDAGVRAVDGASAFDVLFIGTTSGRVLKLYHLKTFKGGGPHSVSRFDRFLEEELGRSSLRAETRPVLVESIQVLPYDIPVRNLIVVEGRLVVLSDHEVKSIPLHRCNTASGHSQPDQPPPQTCNECVALQDPYCAWDLSKGVCAPHQGSGKPKTDFVQELYVGRHASCPATPSSWISSISPSAVAVLAETPANNGSTTTPSPPPDAPLRSNDQDVTGEEGESNLCQNPQKCQCECPLADDARAATSEAAPTESPLESSTSSRASPTFFVPFYDVTSANSNEDFSYSGGPVDSNEDLSVNEIGGDNAELLFGKVGDNSRNVFKTGRHAKNGDVKRQRQEKELNALFNIPSGASVTNQLYNEDSVSALERRIPLLYSGQTLAASTICTAVVALVVGIGIGVCFTKKYGKESMGGATVHPSHSTSGSRRGSSEKQSFDDDSDFYGKTVALKRRAAAALKNCSNSGDATMMQQRQQSSDSSDVSSQDGGSSGGGSTVITRRIDRLHSDVSGGVHNSGYTTPSNLTNTSVTTQATSLSSQASSTASSSSSGSAPSSNPSPVLQGGTGGSPTPGHSQAGQQPTVGGGGGDSPTHVKNLSVNIPHKSEPVKSTSVGQVGLPQLPHSPYRGPGSTYMQLQQQPIYGGGQTFMQQQQHYHVSPQRSTPVQPQTPQHRSQQQIIPNPNAAMATMPRGGLYGGSSPARRDNGGSNTLSRHPSTNSSSTNAGVAVQNAAYQQSPIKLVGTALSPGSTLQKPKRMYI